MKKMNEFTLINHHNFKLLPVGLMAAIIVGLLSMTVHAKSGKKELKKRDVAAESSTNENEGENENGIKADEDEKNTEPTVIKFLKVRKRTAIVVFSKKAKPPQVGQIGQIVPRKPHDKEKDENSIEGISRNRFIALTSSLSSLTTTEDKSKSESKAESFDTNVVYGWNKESFEYGFVFKYSFTKFANTDTKTMEGGILGDYNFGKNVIDRDFLTGVRLSLSMGQTDSSAQKKPGNTMTIEPSVFIKWFGLSPNLAGVLSFGYRNQTYSLDDAKTSTTGLVSNIGIQAYF